MLHALRDALFASSSQLQRRAMDPEHEVHHQKLTAILDDGDEAAEAAAQPDLKEEGSLQGDALSLPQLMP